MTVRGPASLLAAAAVVAVGAASAQARSPQALTVYAVASHATFVDHADDRARGLNKNPFNADIKTLVPRTEAREKGKGPFPGDEAQLMFKIYRGANLKKQIGSAVDTCTDNFAKHALCRADFNLNDGSLFAAGPVDFGASDFTLAVTGGTGRYTGAHGQVSEGTVGQTAGKNSDRFDFDLG